MAGGSTKELQAFLFLPLGEADQRVCGLQLRRNRTAPIVIAINGQSIANRCDFPGRSTRGYDVTGTSRPDRLRVVNQRLGISKPLPWKPFGVYSKGRSGLPIVTLEAPTRGRSGECV